VSDYVQKLLKDYVSLQFYTTEQTNKYTIKKCTYHEWTYGAFRLSDATWGVL